MQKITKDLHNKRVILGSQSMGRQKIIKDLLIKYETTKSDFEENLNKSDFKKPEQYCLATCLHKALDLQKKLKGEDYDLLITADTIVVDKQGSILEKPVDKQQQREFLQSFSNSYCDIITAMVLTQSKGGRTKMVKSFDKARVYWGKIEEEFIDFIIEFDQRLKHCSGSFTIETILGSYIKRIKGDYQTVIGLSIKQLFSQWQKLLKKTE